MKIAIICEVLGEANNGTTVASYNLINYLKSKGHDVRVICPDEDKRGKEGYYVMNRADFGRFFNWYIMERNHLIMPRFEEDFIRDIIKDCDIVHIMLPLFIAKKASKFVKSLGIPLSAGFHAQSENFTAHFGVMRGKLCNHLIYKYYDSNIFCRADVIHYPTQFIKDVFEKHVKRKTNGYVISNGVNSIFKVREVERPEEFKDKFCILFTGRFSKEKSHILLVKAVNRSKYRDKIQLFFAGNGPTEKKIRKYCKRHLPVQPIIGFYSRDDLVNLENRCDLYCHPAEAELEGIACLEAISCGLVPLIANSPNCATKNFALDKRCLFKYKSSKDLAKKIDYFIEHPEVLKELKQKYLQESKTFEQTACMEQMEKMFLETIEKFKKA